MTGLVPRVLALFAASIVSFATLPDARCENIQRTYQGQTNSHGGKKFESVDYQGNVSDHGDLVVIYKHPADKALNEISKSLEQSKAFDQVIKGVNQSIALPQNLRVVFDTCDQANAFYDSEAKQVTMCLELFPYFQEIFDNDDSYTEEEAAESVMQAAVFTLFHELGHALVHLYNLPITGKEEDAVDDLASLLGLAVDQDGGMLWAAIADYYSSAEARDEEEELPFWDEHSLDEQRMYNIACIMYGSDPEGFSDVVDDEWLPEARAAGCQAEYQQKEKSWGQLLKPYLKS